jgi:hypothetical protein
MPSDEGKNFQLPEHIERDVLFAASEEGQSLEEFVEVAVRQRLETIKTAKFFSQRRKPANWDAFDRIMSRDGDEPPDPDDALPATYDRNEFLMRPRKTQ